MKTVIYLLVIFTALGCNYNRDNNKFQEIPSPNKQSPNIQTHIDLSKSKYNIGIRFKPE